MRSRLIIHPTVIAMLTMAISAGAAEAQTIAEVRLTRNSDLGDEERLELTEGRDHASR